VIRVARETTGITGEHRLRLTIRLRDKAALRAGSGGVPGINGDHGNPGQFSLVLRIGEINKKEVCAVSSAT
jgi:hypothetical protein